LINNSKEIFRQKIERKVRSYFKKIYRKEKSKKINLMFFIKVQPSRFQIKISYPTYTTPFFPYAPLSTFGLYIKLIRYSHHCHLFFSITQLSLVWTNLLITLPLFSFHSNMLIHIPMYLLFPFNLN